MTSSRSNRIQKANICKMKRTHLFLQFRKREDTQASSSNSRLFRRRRVPPGKRVCLANKPSSSTSSSVTSISSCSRPPETTPSTSRDARFIQDVFRVANLETSQQVTGKEKISLQDLSDSSDDHEDHNNHSEGLQRGPSQVEDENLLEEQKEGSRAEEGANVKPEVVIVEAPVIPALPIPDPLLAEITRRAGESFLDFHRRTLGRRFRNRKEKVVDWSKRKKKDLDDWNPDMNHPLVKCIYESKLAGLKEMIKPNKGIIWRISWFVAWLSAVIFGIYGSVVVITSHKNLPLNFGFRTKEIATNKIPHPETAICPFYSFKPNATEELENLLEEVESKKKTEYTAEEVVSIMKFVDHICQTKSTLGQSADHYKQTFQNRRYNVLLERMGTSTDFDAPRLRLIRDYIEKNMSLKIDKFLKQCRWNGEIYDCSVLFKPKLTKHGICYVFNGMPARNLYTSEKAQIFKGGDFNWNHWNLESHNFDSEATEEHSDDRDMNPKGPRVQPAGGRPLGLRFLVIQNYGQCAQFDGFAPRVTIRMPGSDGDISKLSVPITLDHDVAIKVTPDLTLAEPEISKIPSDRRGCLFQNEQKLKYYQNYTEENCLRECLANFTAMRCECGLISYPNVPGEELCLAKDDYKCAAAAEIFLLKNKKRYCKMCQPSCSTMTFREETSTVPFSKEARERFQREMKESSYAGVSIFYASDSVVAKERQRKYHDYALLIEIGSIFESTNGFSCLGWIRVFVGLNYLLPAIQALVKGTVKFLLARVVSLGGSIIRWLSINPQVPPAVQQA